MFMSKWSERNWLITGASTGFGRKLTEAVLARGGRVVATARNPGTLRDLESAAGGRLLALQLDVTKGEQMAAVVEKAAAFGGIDVLVNNAGYGLLGAMEEFSDPEIDAIFDVNFFGPVRLTRAVLPQMRARGSGYIVNFSSIAGSYGSPSSSYYSATKFALEGLSEALSKEVQPLGIRVMIVVPGAFRTDFFGRSIAYAANAIPDYGVNAAIRGYVGANDGIQPGDPVRASSMIIEAMEGASPPLRLLLGLESHAAVHAALSERLGEIDAQKDSSLQACFPEALAPVN
jgi:NAD(P)-dependent dehydrogenase (short-subunit alcohol dehydrogenase family)